MFEVKFFLRLLPLHHLSSQLRFSFLSTAALTSLLDSLFFHPPPRLWLPAYLCCRLNFLIDILTFPLLLIYLHPLLVSKPCSFKASVLFYLWERISVFHSMFFMLLPRPSRAPVNHPRNCHAPSALLLNPLSLSGALPFLGTPGQLKLCTFFIPFII